jgi:hypothetical protein
MENLSTLMENLRRNPEIRQKPLRLKRPALSRRLSDSPEQELEAGTTVLNPSDLIN